MSLEFGYALPALNNLGAVGTYTPALNINFLSGTLDSRITFTRASTATYYDSTGTLQTAAINAPRFDYNPSTLAARGLLIEEQRTNSIRNNTMQGAVAGTPGTQPTNWAIGGTTTGLTISVIGTGTANGINYIDIRFNGTAGAALNPNILFDTSSGIAATNGQSWAWSTYLSLVGGSLTNVTNIIPVISMFNSTPSLLGTLSGSAITPTNAGLATQRTSYAATLNQTTTAYIRPQLQFNVANGAAVDVTLRIGLPQLEQGAFATSVIPTTTAAATRSADLATMTGTNFSSWYTQSQGTFVTQFVWEGLKTVAGQRVITTDDGTTTNQMQQGAGSSNALLTTLTTAGATEVNTSTPATTFVAGTVYKSALAYATNNTVAALNGTIGTTDTVCAMPTALTTFRFSPNASTPTVVNANVWYASLKFYPIRLANGTLQVLTT